MTDDLFEVDSTKEEPAVVLRVRVQPGAGRSAVAGRHGDALALRVGAPPVGGRANAACVELVADVFGVRPSQVEVVSGEHNRQKRLRLSGVSAEHAREAISRELRAATAKAQAPSRQRR